MVCKKYGPFNLQHPVAILYRQAVVRATDLLKSSFLTYAVHIAQSREGSLRHLLDAVLVDPHLNQRGRQVPGDGGQQIPGEVKPLHVLQRDESSGVDFGDFVISQRETLKNRNGRQMEKTTLAEL